MAYFAVNCRNGFNAFQLKEVIERVFPQAVKEQIKAIVSPVAFIQKKIADGKVKRMVKELGGGYIYLQIDTDHGIMPVEVFERLNGLPWITQTFREDIATDEVEAFCNNIGLQLEESEIVFEIECVHEEKIQELVQEINGAETRVEHKEAEEKLDNELSDPTCIVKAVKKMEQRTGRKVNKEQLQSETFLLDMLYQYCQLEKTK